MINNNKSTNPEAAFYVNLAFAKSMRVHTLLLWAELADITTNP